MRTLVALFIFLATCAVGIGQTKITFSGTVQDNGMHAVEGATVKLLNTNFSAISNNKGEFTLENVFPGSFILEVSAINYGTKTQQVAISNQQQSFVVTLTPAPGILGEVVVTAQKSEELLKTVPISVTSVSANQVNDYRLWNSKELTAIAPNFYAADPGDKRNVYALRGIATTSYDPAVATYIDGVNQFNLDTYISQLFDVERIEVLRGPQGTLYGRNAMGGVVNIITKQPTNTTSGFAEFSLGNYGQQRYTAGVRLPLVSDKLFFGAAALYDKSNGFYTNEFNNSHYDRQHSFTGNYYLKYLPGANWSIALNAKHTENRNHGPFPLVFGADEALANPYKLNQNALTNLVDNLLNTSLSVNYYGKQFNFVSQTAYQTNYRIYETPIDADFSPIDGITLANNYGKDWNKVKVLTEELKFSSPASASTFKWTAGSYLFHQTNPVKQATRFGKDAAYIDPNIQPNSSLINTTKATSTGVAVYAQADLKLTDQLSLTGGLRYDYEHKNQSVLGEYQADPDPNPIFEYRSDTSATANFHAFSPKLTFSYIPGKGGLLFASFTRGFRAGGLTPLSSDPGQPALFSYQPEYSNNFEVGSKHSLLNNHLSLNFSAFYTTINNAQVPTLILPDAVTITRNTGKLVSKGVEVEAAAMVKGLQIDYNLGYTHATYKQLNLSQNGTTVDLKGKKQIFTPAVTSMLATQYKLALSKTGKGAVTFRAEWRYLGNQYFDLSNSIMQKAYSVFNAKVQFDYKNVYLAAWQRNIADKRYISYAYDFGAVHLGDPRTTGATVGFRF